MTLRSFVLASVAVFILTHCGAASPQCGSGACAQGGLVLNELAGTGDDFVELFNASDSAVDLSGYGLARVYDGAETFAVQHRSPGTANAP